MKTFTFKFDPNVSLKQMFDEFKKAMNSKTNRIEEDTVLSPSIDAIFSSMNKTKLDLFYCIAQMKPTSLYHLAKLLDRDYANVLRDAKSLEMIGLIELRKNSEGERDKLRPIALYDRIVFDFGAASAKTPKQPDEKSA